VIGQTRAESRSLMSATTDATPLVMPLQDVGRSGLAVVGGKGANLGELVRAGFPVPPGFVVTTAAYDRFVMLNGLGETITRTLHEAHGTGAAIRAAFEGAPIPAEIEQVILAAYQQLGRGPVAVRSSATAEDLPGAAFAGQQDTYLNIVGGNAVLGAIRHCWASLWSDRAIAYRERLGLDQQTVKIAVVVQRILAAEAAGVLFTANTVTGARDEIVIDASPGLGEAVVSGQVTPDHFILRKRRWGWSVAQRQMGRREVIIRARAGGGTEHIETPATADVPSLPDRYLRQLARIGVAIQRHFSAPQDVEWAWAEGQLFILQARPITALPEPAPRPSRPVQMLAGIFAEILPVRPYPLEMTTWGPALLLSALLAPILRLLGLTAPIVEQLFVEEDGVVVQFSSKLHIRPTLRILTAPVRLLRLARRYDPAHWQADPLLAEAQSQARALESHDLRALTREGLLATVREAPAIPRLTLGELRLRYFPRAALIIGRLRLALVLLQRTDLFGTLLFSGVETKVLETIRALEALAARIRSDPALADAFASHEARALWAALEGLPLGRAFLKELRAFLDHYGHREAGATLLVSQSTWKDSPEVVLGMLKGLAVTPPSPEAERPAWEAARDELLVHPLLRFRPLRSAFLGTLVKARCFPQLREDTRFYAMLPLPVLRRTLREFGRRLVGIGVLDVPMDVFHFKLDELGGVGGTWPPPPHLTNELRALVARRKEKRDALGSTPLVDPRLYRQPEPGGDVLLRGMAGSPGVAEGPARIIRDSSAFDKLRAGDVLVAPYTNPAWTPLFQRAIAVVVDTGGAASHAAIVVPEYGIPAVMGTIDGTQRLTDDQHVQVDGNRGLVLRGSRATLSQAHSQNTVAL
jgi:rifampicin phosphotransferase